MRVGVVGHVVIDEVVSRLGRRVSPGGVPTYAGLTIASLGHEALAVSNIGADGVWLLERLRELGVDTTHVNVLESWQTTRFRIERLDGERRMWVPTRCVDISPQQLEIDADSLYLGPVIGEISSELVADAVKRFRMVALDPQGLMRALGPERSVELRPIGLEALRGLGLLRLSEEEYCVLGYSGPREAVVEISKRLGCDVLASSISQGVWICGGGAVLRGQVRPSEVVDTVGAGDVVGGAYLVGLLETGDRAYALALAMAAVKHRIRLYGPARLDNKAVRRDAEEMMATIEKWNI
ncbi:MAG: PfkB family carbohydrate kinase [Nitrososphaerota archaeon]|nr:PfkB family carbohydrate kinase [Candidatus Calditenuaceae archaeon]MDW8073920.1 PfkB family carbohydrate kinase [Nitrososphaerota archaeon]